MPDATDLPKFDFITDDAFRHSLDADYRELTRCLEDGAWKAVHVLAGSVVEAILTDYLVGIGYQKKTGKDPLRMELAPVIQACKDERIITERTADLSTVIRSYRNLIHPGRLIRLNERVDQRTASIAKALVDVVADEVGSARAATYGFTAEQIVNKVEKDSSAIAVLSHLLKDMHDRERERLVIDVLPQRYFFARELGDESSAADYKTCHRQAFETLSDEAKTDVAKRFVKILKEESGDYVVAYENLFFRASDLQYLPANDVAIVKAHLLNRLDKEQSAAILDVSEGLGPFLKQFEIGRAMNAYAKVIAYGKSQPMKQTATFLLFMLHSETQGDVCKELEKRMDGWIDLMASKGMDEQKAALEEIKSQWATEIPF